MTKILLLGSTGKLGKSVLKELVHDTAFEIALAVRNLSARDFSNIYNLKLFEGDITKANSIDSAVEWADIVINCSGYVSYKRNDREKLWQINVEGIRNITDACIRFQKKLIHTSTAGVYGSTKQPVLFQEDKYPETSYKTAYFRSKTEAEKIVIESNITYIILRPGSLICTEKSTLNSLYNFYKKGFIAGLKGGASFALMHDAAKAYLPALKLLVQAESNNGLIFNLGGNNLTFKEIFKKFKSFDNRKVLFLPNTVLYILSRFNDYILFPVFNRSLITYENYQTGNHFTFVDSSKAEDVLGYKITSFEGCFDEMV